MNQTAINEIGIPSKVLHDFYHLTFHLTSGNRNAPLDINTRDSYNLTDRSKFTHAVSYLHGVMGLSSFVYAFVGPDDQNSTWNVMQMGQAGLSLPSRDYYLNKDADDPTILAFKIISLRCLICTIVIPIPPSTKLLSIARMQLLRLKLNWLIYS
mmetsp:Transcript_1883/g.1995  ORF Transcript_1883/g.1995 Transcript_1883/m.1995 type:complete len:154 (-) Transcript_1883:501-962(-)